MRECAVEPVLAHAVVHEALAEARLVLRVDLRVRERQRVAAQLGLAVRVVAARAVRALAELFKALAEARAVERVVGVARAGRAADAFFGAAKRGGKLLLLLLSMGALRVGSLGMGCGLMAAGALIGGVDRLERAARLCYFVGAAKHILDVAARNATRGSASPSSCPGGVPVERGSKRKPLAVHALAARDDARRLGRLRETVRHVAGARAKVARFLEKGGIDVEILLAKAGNFVGFAECALEVRLGAHTLSINEKDTG